MSNLDNNVLIQISAGSPSVARKGFGALLIAATGLGAGFTERVRRYALGSSQPATDVAGGDITSAVKDAIDEAFGVKLSVPEVLVGRIEADVAQVIHFDFANSPEVGDKLAITINGILTERTAVGTVLNTEVDALRSAMVTALAAQPVTVGGVSPQITVTADTAGEPFTYASLITLVGTGPLTVTETVNAANVSIKTELDAIIAADGDWYGLVLGSRNATQIQRAAEWVESQPRAFFAQTSDADMLTTATTSIADTVKTLSYARTAVAYHADDTEHMDAAWLSYFLATDPDVDTTIAAYKPLAGITIQSQLTDTQRSNLESKNANYYSQLKGIGATWPGKKADGEYIDVLLSEDWAEARIGEDAAQKLTDASANGRKIPYTDAGIAVMESSIRNVLSQGEAIGHFVPGSSVVTPPKRSSVSAGDLTARKLSIPFSTKVAGAIQTIAFTGTLEVTP